MLMMIVQVSEGESATPRRLEIDKSEIILGKHADCDVVLASTKVSRHHARIFEKNGGLALEALKSTNGKIVNGQAVSGERSLGGDEVIRIGAHEVRVERAAKATSQAKEAPGKQTPAAAPAPKETDEVKKARMFWASMESFFQPIWKYIEDAKVSEIMINGPNEIYVEQKGHLERAP